MRKHSRRGGALIAALVTLLAVSLVAAAVVRRMVTSQRQVRQQHHELQAQWLAESAIDRALTQLARQPNYSGESWPANLTAGSSDSQPPAVEIRIETDAASESNRRIIAIAHFPNHEWQRVTVRREHIIPPISANARAAPAENAP